MGNHNETKTINRGCAKGFKCGPGMYLIAMNDLLGILSNLYVSTYAFADDILIKLDREETEDLAIKAKMTLKIITKWGRKSGLSFNPNKTQSMMVSQKKTN